MLKEQNIYLKINTIKLPNVTPEQTVQAILKDILPFVKGIRSDIKDAQVLEATEKSVLVLFSMKQGRPITNGHIESDEEREESVKVLVEQMVVSERKDCRSVSIGKAL